MPRTKLTTREQVRDMLLELIGNTAMDCGTNDDGEGVTGMTADYLLNTCYGSEDPSRFVVEANDGTKFVCTVRRVRNV